MGFEAWSASHLPISLPSTGSHSKQEKRKFSWKSTPWICSSSACGTEKPTGVSLHGIPPAAKKMELVGAWGRNK